MTTQHVTVTVLIKPLNERTGRSDCVQCDRLKAYLDKNGVEYTTLVIGTPEAQDELDKAVAEGIQAAPITVVRGEKTTVRFTGYNLNEVKRLILPFIKEN